MQIYLPLLLSALIVAGGDTASAQIRPAAQQPGASQSMPPLLPATRKAVVAALAQHLRSDYVFPETGVTMADAVAAKLAKGGYEDSVTALAFGDALTQDLRALGKDAHLRVRFEPDYQAPPSNEDNPMDSAHAAVARRMVAQRGFGISAVQRLPGNVGYLDVRGFGPTPFVADAYAEAMSLLSGTESLIVDMRQNGGGEPQSVTELVSYFFGEGDARHLNDLYSRTDGSMHEYWTNLKVTAHYVRPIYVLTSHDTFSGGEEFAYDLQTQKRATLVGETTGGGANPGDNVRLAEGFIAFIPTGRAINPVTKTNWEKVGVIPDVKTTAVESLKVAYIASLKGMIARSNDPGEREGLSDIVAKTENGQVQLPGYTPRR